MNGCAVSIGGGLCKAKEAIWQRAPRQRLSFPFLLTSLGWLDKFSSGVVNDRFHRLNDNTSAKQCQAELPGGAKTRCGRFAVAVLTIS